MTAHILFQPCIAALKEKRAKAKAPVEGPSSKKPKLATRKQVTAKRGRGRGRPAWRNLVPGSTAKQPAGPLVPPPAYPIGRGVPRVRAPNGQLLASFLK